MTALLKKQGCHFDYDVKKDGVFMYTILSVILFPRNYFYLEFVIIGV